LLTVDCGEAASPPMLILDAGRVPQIAGNLLSNAIKFTDMGTVATEVSAYAGEGGRIDVTINVIDTGPGVPAAVAKTIFLAFERASGNS
jgi:signal transduction histidine kinase